MASFRYLVLALLGHTLVDAMYRIFARYTGLSTKLGMLAIAPIQIAVFLAISTVVEGARTKDGILRVVKGGFAPVLGVTRVMSLTAIIFAQMFLPSEVCGSHSIQLLHQDHFPQPLSLSGYLEVLFLHLVQFCARVRLPQLQSHLPFS